MGRLWKVVAMAMLNLGDLYAAYCINDRGKKGRLPYEFGLFSDILCFWD